MLHCFDFIREMNMLAITARLVLAVLCGGVIGLEREVRRRSAGFRTHILICMGSAITILTNLYLYQVMNLYTDISRMGAQVIAGVSFVGAGTIIVTRSSRVKGLTTAAGLWTASIIGLACGAGYAECAIFATLMVMFAELVLIRIEYRFVKRSREINLYVEYSLPSTVQRLVRVLRTEKIPMNDMEVNRMAEADGSYRYSAILTILLTRQDVEQKIIKEFEQTEGVLAVEKL